MQVRVLSALLLMALSPLGGGDMFELFWHLIQPFYFID